MKTIVYKKQPAQFDMCGKFLGYPLLETNEEISNKLCDKLLKYAEGRLKNNGLDKIVSNWEVKISTINNNDPKDRIYDITWRNKEKFSITLNNILLRDGKPFLDHRFSVDED